MLCMFKLDIPNQWLGKIGLKIAQLSSFHFLLCFTLCSLTENSRHRFLSDIFGHSEFSRHVRIFQTKRIVMDERSSMLGTESSSPVCHVGICRRDETFNLILYIKLDTVQCRCHSLERILHEEVNLLSFEVTETRSLLSATNIAGREEFGMALPNPTRSNIGNSSPTPIHARCPLPLSLGARLARIDWRRWHLSTGQRPSTSWIQLKANNQPLPR